MIFKKTGKIIDDLYLVGHPAMPVYLLDGQRPAIFDAGLAFLGRLYVNGIREIIDRRDLHYCFLSHSHFDHCGSVAVLKKNYFQKSMADCRHFLNLVECALEECEGDLQKVIARIKAVEYDPVPEPKQIEPAYLLNLERPR
jgi:glyoxylase-like metal-dependent hydrolase (beta-lactamase superfamily II)